MKLIDRQKSANQLLNWIEKNEPGFYRHVKSKLNRGLGEDEIQVDWLDRIFSTVETAVPIYFAAEERKDLMELQLEMARAGQPPVDVRSYQTPIPIRHEVAVPGIYDGRPMNPDTKKWLTIGGISALALVVFKAVAPKPAK